jgi:hypothetical protein
MRSSIPPRESQESTALQMYGYLEDRDNGVFDVKKMFPGI